MRGVFGVAILLAIMACADLWFSSTLIASMHKAEHVTQLASQSTDIDTVEQALNSRYMQWGAVGVMISLFVWIITVHQPRQERQRDTERKSTMETFIAATERKDENFLTALNDIRRSVETHVEKNHTGHDKLSDCVHELTLELRSGR